MEDGFEMSEFGYTDAAPDERLVLDYFGRHTSMRSSTLARMGERCISRTVYM